MNNLKKVLILLMFCSFHSYAAKIIAVNIALKVPSELEKNIMGINANLKQESPESFLFDSSHFAHVTILQFFVDSSKLKEVEAVVLKHISNNIKLKIKDFSTKSTDKRPDLSLLSLEFKDNVALTELQMNLIEDVRKLKNSEASAESFYMNDVDPEFIKYVTDFFSENTGANYHPHVTLGLAKEKNQESYSIKPNDEFIFDEIIIAQVGNFGTARSILKSFKLKKI